MKLTSLSVKRRTVKKSAFRTLFANVARKKQRASVAAAPAPEMESDVPNLGISRALFVILIIHVVAIAGIFAHSHWFEGDAKAAVAKQPVIEPAKPLRDAGVKLPKIEEAYQAYPLVSGDTYEKIAVEHGVEVEALRKLNDNMELRAGRVLKVPPQTIVALEPEELVRQRNGSAVLESIGEAPPVATRVDELRNAPMVETDAVAQPVLVRPKVSHPATARTEAAATPVTTAAAPAFSKKYTVKNGDTFWKIAQAHKTTPEAVMKANRISDPRKLKPGMSLQVP